MKRLSGTVTAVTGEGGICPGHNLSQKTSRMIPTRKPRARLGASLARGPPRETRSTGQERFEVAEELVHDVAHLHIPGIHERPRCAPRQAGTAGVLPPEDGVRCR